MNLAQLPMSDILESVEVLVLRWHLHRAAPTSRAVEKFAVRIRNFRPIDIEGVVMKAFIEWPRITGPGAVLAPGKRAAVFEAHCDALGLGRNDAELHAAFGVDLRIFFAGLIGRR